MVLAPFGPAVTVDPNGPNQQSGMRSVPVDQGGTVAQTVTGDDLNAAIETQGPVPTFNPFQEVQEFIGELCRIYSAIEAAKTPPGTPIAPMAMVVRVIDILNAIRSQCYNA